MLEGTEILGILRLSQHFELFIMLLKPIPEQFFFSVAGQIILLQVVRWY